MTHAWQAFPHTPIIGSTGTVDLIGNTLFAVGAIVLLAAAVLTLNRARGSEVAGSRTASLLHEPA